MLQVSWRPPLTADWLQEQQTMDAVSPPPLPYLTSSSASSSSPFPPPAVSRHPSLTQAQPFHPRPRPQTRTYGAVWDLRRAFRWWFWWFWWSWCLLVFPRSSPSVSAWQWQRWEGLWWRWAIAAPHRKGLQMTWEVTCSLTAARQGSPPTAGGWLRIRATV